MDYDRLALMLDSDGSAKAAEHLVRSLLEQGDLQAAFYAKLMKARVALGVSPFPTGASGDLPSDVHEPYEEAIRTAARETGAAFIAKKDLPRAWGYYRLINEPQKIREALDVYEPGPEDELYPILDIAWYQRVHPKRGFELLLTHHGICSAITTLGSTDLSHDPALRVDCIRMLVKSLHSQLLERLAVDQAELAELLSGPEFAAEVYHLDVSHLASVVQMSLELPPGDDSLPLALDLSNYGRKLDPSHRGTGDPPFENLYDDYSKFLEILNATNVDENLKHFEAKIEQELTDGNTFPAEVLVNLLVKLKRLPAAIAISKKHFSNLPPDAQLSCPSIAELARTGGEFQLLTETARANGDAVTFLAAMIAQRSAIR